LLRSVPLLKGIASGVLDRSSGTWPQSLLVSTHCGGTEAACMGIDALSDVLKGVRLTGAIFFDVDAFAPWAAAAPRSSALVPMIMPGVDHIIEYHVIAEGSCFVSIADEKPVRLEAGTVVVLPHGDAHVLSNPEGQRAVFDPEVFNRARQETVQLPLNVVEEGRGDHTHIVCGFLGCDRRPFNPLLAALPRLLLVRESLGSTESRIGQFVRLAMAEAKNKRPGGESVLARLCELMFVEVVRRHLETIAGDEPSWLAGLRDRHVGDALSILHARPTYGWTLDELAREVGLSRSVLTERFGHFVGMPPMQYLARWRMQIAARLLCDSDVNIATVADEVGYGSEASFSRAFKKLVGAPPAAWRRTRNAEPARPGVARPG
jgi:AraC-like DNA-binding protein